MQKQFIIRLIMLVVMLTGCASLNTPSEIYKGQSAEQLYTDAESDLANGHYSAAVQRFEALDSLYPFAPQSEQAHLDIIYAYYKAGDDAAAVSAANRFIREYPGNPHVDYAYYLRGLANYRADRTWFTRYLPLDPAERDAGSAKEAFNDFSTLLKLYPNSPYAPDARQRMIYLRNGLARHEVGAAQYYFQRAAYVAAINRSAYVVQHYQRTPSTAKALAIMVKSYRALGLNDRADETMQVLALNYPNSSDLAALRRHS